MPAPKAAARPESTVNIFLDYCGTCNGGCPTCVLTSGERAAGVPLMSAAAAEAALADMAASLPEADKLVLGIGRANNLVLPESSMRDHLRIAAAACAAARFNSGAAEITTSLVGKLEPQIERAKRITDAFAAAGLPIEARFAVVGNTTLSSAPYWDNLDRFFRAMEEMRGGGEKDGNGDVLALNVTVSHLPEMGVIEGLVSAYRFPVNIVWVPMFDPGIGEEASLARFGDWLAEFVAMAVRVGVDANVVNWTRQAAAFRPTSVEQVAEHVAESTRRLFYVAPDGSWHHGFASVLSDMDPVRFDPLSTSVVDGHRVVVADPKRDLAALLRNKSCTACPHFFLCGMTGVYKHALLALRRYPNGTRTCPCGMRGVFEAATDWSETP
jgi:hypothetical protein